MLGVVSSFCIGTSYRLHGIGNTISTFQVPYCSKEAYLDYGRIDYTELLRAQLTNIKSACVFLEKLASAESLRVHHSVPNF